MATFRIKTGNGDAVVYTDETKHKEMRQRAKRNSLLAQSDSPMQKKQNGLNIEKHLEIWILAI